VTAGNALVVGGTGPTGPYVVDGLLAKGFQVAVFHTGSHEYPFASEVEHIHADPHFQEPIEGALAGRHFDLTICMYGRTRLLADALVGHSDRVFAIGGVFYKGWVDGYSLHKHKPPGPRPIVYSNPPIPVTEEYELEDTGSFSARAIETERLLRQHHEEGHYASTFFRYPKLYGRRQLGPLEWSAVRRVIDKRTRVLLPDGGLIADSRIYSENAAQMILAAVDHPEASGGQTFNCGDREPVTVREWFEIMGSALDFQFEFESVPMSLAGPALSYGLGPWQAGHRVLSVAKAELLLGYEPVPAPAALAETALWYLEHPLASGSEQVQQLGDPFDYELEDRIVAGIAGVLASFGDELSAIGAYSHPYAHPDKPKAPAQ
jgi:nucleoside-diphosphate-sugar epimerase